MSREAFTAAGLNLPDTIGAFSIGNALQCFLCGWLIQMAIEYYQNFKTDKTLYRWLVHVLVVLNLVHTAFTISSVYYWTVTGWGSVAAINNGLIQYPLSWPLTGLVTFIVQFFFAYRIWIISDKQWYVPAATMAVSVTQLGASIYVCIYCLIHNQQSDWAVIFPPSYVWMYGGAVADFFITVAMIFYLQRMKDSTVFDRTRSVVNRMCILTFETNALTFVVELTVAALLQIRKDGWGPCFNFCLVKLYTISLLVSLNASNAKSQLATGLSSGFASQFNKGGNTIELTRSRGAATNNGIEVSHVVDVDFGHGSDTMDEKVGQGHYNTSA